MSNFLLLEDNKVIGSYPTEELAVESMKAEHRRDLLGIIAKRRLLNLFINGKYKLKEYAVVKVVTVKTINSDDDLNIIGGTF